MASAYVIPAGWAIDATKFVRRASTETTVWNRVIVLRATLLAMLLEGACAALGSMETSAINLAQRRRCNRQKRVSTHINGKSFPNL